MNPQGVETTAVTLAYSFTVNVSAKELTVTGATAASRDYDGTNAVKITKITLVGIVTGDTVSVDLTGVQGILSSVNAGTYTSVTLPELTLTGTDAGNYTLIQPEGAVTTNVTINKLDAELTVGTASYDKTFGDAAFTLDVTDTNAEANVKYEVTAGDDVVSVSNGTVTILKAGTATITVSLSESTNYNAAESKTITVNVAKDTYIVTAINKSYLYSRNNADTINIAGLLPTDCGTATYGVQTSGNVQYACNALVSNGILTYTVASGTVNSEGTITVTVTTENYKDIMITVNVKLIDQIPVSLKEGTEVTLKNSILTYGEALSKLVFNTAEFVGSDGNIVAGTLAWKDATATPNARTTSATWVFTPDSEEYTSVEGTVAITVNKATPTVSAVPTVADRVYNPSVALADSDLTGGTASVEGTWSWQTANVVPVVNNSGYVAVFTPNDTTNYETVTKTITVVVTKATPVITELSGTTITYGNTLSASVLSGSAQYDNTAVAGSFAWKDASVKPAVADSNNTAYAVVFTPADTANYSTVESKITLTVNKAENAPNMPGNTMSVPYSNKTVSAVALPDGWAWQDADKDTELEVGVSVNATAVYTGADKGNYENETVVVAITRSDCEHTNTEVRNKKTATCEHTGYTGDTYCKDCGECTATGTEIPLAAHTGGTAACTKKAKCSVCGKEYGSVDSSKHGETEIKGYVAATCTAGGYTGDTYCKDCGVKTASGTTTAALGHDYKDEVTKEPTTTEEGGMTYTCSACGHTYTKAIDKLTDDGSDNNEDNKPDTGKPFIKGDEGKKGWDVIRDEVGDTKVGETITVDMNGITVVPGDVFDDIKGRDITIVFDIGNGVTWSVNGKDITSGNVGDIDFGVKVGADANNTIPSEVINKVTGERYYMNISLSYDGEFGFGAVLSLNMETKNAGLFANLYYFNEQKGEIEFICADEIAADGTAELTFTHASEYTIVIDENSMEKAPETGDTTAPETGDTGTSDGDAWRGWWIVLLGAVVIIVGLGFFVSTKKRKK